MRKGRDRRSQGPGPWSAGQEKLPSCFRIGTDEQGNSYIAVAGAEEHFLTDSREALQQMIRDIKAGKADHLL
ncbi:hypothetical protein OG609_14770 [Streptomyces sp. NBC_01224]|uniref:hypothetical protein n=1 Tax=Streptomyces sp. NBC_01224 TaxID=2903783 RepID=UPI002E153F21|nr:hypothetical protein OG609_14770 [Streptomyces sp. NBC_01224]